ncbi:MAG: V-type ATPase subunit [Lentisphaeria bacterium]|nr:V-type ATPase subunit [Lentisphaeria bacterium]
MAIFTHHLGADYLYARVHGWWSRSAQGEILESLTRAATEENFFHQLQSFGVLSVTDTDRVLEQLVLRQYDRLGKLGAHLGGSWLKYMEALRNTLERENIKAILNYRFFPERESHLSDSLVHFPSNTIRENDFLALMDATTTEQFIRLLPESRDKEEYARITLDLAKDKDIMRAECAVDALSFRREMEATRGLTGEMRTVLQDFQGRQADHTNIITLVRNANFYHLDAKKLSYAWVDGGKLLKREFFDHMAAASSVEAVIDALPVDYRSVLTEDTSRRGFGALENRLHCQLAQEARKTFYDAVNPLRSLAVYPLLLEQETVNLSRIYEGIRFSLPPRDIAAMMIR